MVATGWSLRKLGDNGEELCRALDVVLAGVESLKAAVRREGLKMDGEGEIYFCWKEMWCKDVLWTPAGTVSNIEIAKSALRSMKDANKAILSISNSLDQAIGTITEPVVQHSNEIGLAKLPDDVLAQIFEIYHLDKLEKDRNPYISPQTLSSVCRRFRDIAVHLPSLWHNVVSHSPKKWLSLCTQRCRNPRVLLKDGYKLGDFMDHIQPYQEWEELDMRCRNETYGHRFFEQLGPRINDSFSSLKRLGICNYRENRIEAQLTNRTVLKADELALASWRFPNVTYLELITILPTMPWSCPSVTRFKLSFTPQGAYSVVWSLQSLRNFLQAMPLLESLELTFHYLMTFKKIGTLVDPLELPRLKAISIILDNNPSLLIVSNFMNLIDTALLTKLSVRIAVTGHAPPNVQPPFLHDGAPDAWMKAIFTRFDASGNDVIRPYPGVLDFALDVQIPESPSPPFDTVFASLPNVRFLSLKLPEFVTIDLVAWVRACRGLRELRTLRIQEYIRPGDPKYTRFFSNFWLGNRENFGKLEVIGSFRAERFEEHVRDKLVRTGESQGASFYPV